MYTLLESKSEIAKAQKALEATIRSDLKKTEVKDIGWQGGNRKGARLSTNGKYWYWSANRNEGPNPRRLNWFGICRDGPGVQISVEINTPYEGRNDVVAGFFARNNDSGRTYLFHSGRVGGGGYRQ